MPTKPAAKKDGRGRAKKDEPAELELQTVDIDGVEVLAAGGPYFGQGSPPEGDEFSEDELAEICAANVELADEIKPFLKIGHNGEQKLLKASGLAEDEKPAAGWFENWRVEGGKLLADAKRVPKKLAKLVKAGAFRRISVELSKIVGQDGDRKGKTYKRVVTAVSLLGATAPAVHTLDDIIALYAKTTGSDPVSAAELLELDEAGPSLAYAEHPEHFTVELVRYAEGDVVWDPEDGCQGLMDRVRAALNPGPGSNSYWVMDVSRDATRAIVEEYNENRTWVVPFEIDGDGSVSIAPSSDWTLAERAWVESARELAESAASAHALGVSPPAADTSPRMPEKPATPMPAELTTKQVATLAETFGITETDEAKRLEAVTAKLSEFVPAAPAAAAPVKPEGEGEPKDEPTIAPEPTPALAAAALKLLEAKADRGDQAYAELQAEKADRVVEKALSEGRIDPADEVFWKTAYGEDADRTVTLLSKMPVNPDFVKAYGKDNDGVLGTGGDDRFYEDWAAFSKIEDPLTLQKATA